MKSIDDQAFSRLFSEACEKCFGHPLSVPLSETESKMLCAKVLDATGLVIGPKSVKNYSFYILGTDGSKKENPSTATLDTLARYVMNAPYTDEGARKEKEAHYPWWFQYRNNVQPVVNLHKGVSKWIYAVIAILIGLTGIGISFLKDPSNTPTSSAKVFNDDFDSTTDASLQQSGWIITSRDSVYWPKRDSIAGALTLFTMKGDNWPNATTRAGIRNLMMKPVISECFTAEVHFDRFIPARNWEQAGLLLLENENAEGKALRLSISYNDFFGGFKKSPEIIIQVLSSAESGDLSLPEEVAHFPLFNLDAGMESIVLSNLAKSVLKIEKKGDHFRLLYSTGDKETFAFKEIVSRNFAINPKYIGLFAIQGFSDATAPYRPAVMDKFSMASLPCE